MTSAFEQVKVDASCLSQECEKQGCRVGLDDLSRPFHLIDMDHPKAGATGSRCDYLLVGVRGPNELYVVALELKSSGFHATSVSKQLTGGARVANRMVPKVDCLFVPVVTFCGAHRGEINKLAKHPVCFRGSPCRIHTMKCGKHLADALARASG